MSLQHLSGALAASALALAAGCAATNVETMADDMGADDMRPGRAMAAVPPPQADDCITDVSPGDHTFVCDGLTFKVMVDEMCTRVACGLIFDIHGAGMTADRMRANTELHELAPPRGYLVVHPSAAGDEGGSWSYDESGAQMTDFMDRMIAAFHADESRVHVTGFSMGAAMTFWFMCNHPEKLASVGVVTGSSAAQVRTPDGSRQCIEAIDADWSPQAPILFLNGVNDPALTGEAAQERTDGLVARLGLTGGEVIAGGETLDENNHYRRRHWEGEDGMALDFIEHDYVAEGRLAGHCMPGAREVNSTNCTEGDVQLHWGELALEWFMDHPKS